VGSVKAQGKAQASMAGMGKVVQAEGVFTAGQHGMGEKNQQYEGGTGRWCQSG